MQGGFANVFVFIKSILMATIPVPLISQVNDPDSLQHPAPERRHSGGGCNYNEFSIV
jgi:hypothetical protein